jgi:carboxyl-terminal processing protease
MNEHTPSPSTSRLPLYLAIALAAGMLIGQQLPRTNRLFGASGQLDSNDLNTTLSEILQFVSARYVDTLDAQRISNSTIEHLLRQLDPHSVYISPDEARASEEEMQGGFEGIGVEFIMLEDTIQIVSPIPGGPSESVGVLPGDKIVTINDTTVAGVKITDGAIFKKLRGHKGTVVKLGIRRGAERDLRHFNVTRDVIALKSVDVAYMLDATTGYVRITSFTAKTYNEFMEALRPLVEDQGLQNLILDLRGNPGGYLQEATQLLSQIFPEGKLLVYTQGRMDAKQEFKSTGRARFRINQVAVLMDEGSASASEIVAGAIQDNDRGWIVGRRSYGKGLVQEEYDLSNGGKLRLTTARYYTASGRSIQRPYNNGLDYQKEDERRIKSGELTDPTKFVQTDTNKYYTGLGRVVYGGGGITPDVFIPLDTSFITPYFVAVNGHIAQFMSRWVERQDRNGFPKEAREFIQSYQIPANVLDELTAYTTQQGVAPRPAELNRVRQELMVRLKARLGRILFDINTEMQILNGDDPAVEKAWQLVRSNTPITNN